MREIAGRSPAAVRCQGCAQTWLMPGARSGETYICKACGHTLRVAEPSAAGERAGFGPRRASDGSPGLNRRTGGGC